MKSLSKVKIDIIPPDDTLDDVAELPLYVRKPKYSSPQDYRALCAVIGETKYSNNPRQLQAFNKKGYDFYVKASTILVWTQPPITVTQDDLWEFSLREINKSLDIFKYYPLRIKRKLFNKFVSVHKKGGLYNSKHVVLPDGVPPTYIGIFSNEECMRKALNDIYQEY